MDIKNSLNEGIQNGLKTLITTSLIMGYGNLVKSMDSFSVITEGLYSAFNSEIISNIVAINIIAALTGSSATSLQLFLKHFLTGLRHCLILLKIYIELWRLLRADWILCHMRQG